MMTEQLLRIGKAAKYLGLSIDTLRRYDEKGILPSIKLPSGHRRYPLDVLNTFLNGPKNTETLTVIFYYGKNRQEFECDVPIDPEQRELFDIVFSKTCADYIKSLGARDESK